MPPRDPLETVARSVVTVARASAKSYAAHGTATVTVIVTRAVTVTLLSELRRKRSGNVHMIYATKLQSPGSQPPSSLRPCSLGPRRRPAAGPLAAGPVTVSGAAQRHAAMATGSCRAFDLISESRAAHTLAGWPQRPQDLVTPRRRLCQCPGPGRAPAAAAGHGVTVT